jgi:Phage tail lysozyme
MPTIIDSLFLELGIDTTKFSKDQQRALAKIQQFESQTKRSAGNARGQIQTVGDAFRDLTKDSRVGSSAAGIDSLATKLKNLGMSMQVSGGVGTPLGGIARGLGMLLSPAALGAAAIGLVAKEAWDFNKSMTASNATLARNAELSGMSATNLWAMGQAAKTVGGNAEGIEASIASLQTSLAGMSIGAGSAVPQLIGMARLARYGARFNPGGFGQGVDEESLFKAVNQMYQTQGRAKTLAMVTQYGLMNEDQANLAMSANGWKEYQDAQAKAKAMTTGGGFEAVVRNSLQSQAGLGEKDIAGAIAAETAYGGIQQPMQTIVGLLTNIYGVITAIYNFLAHPGKIYDATVEGASRIMDDVADAGHTIMNRMLPNSMRSGMSRAMQTLMGNGLSEDAAAAIVGNMAQESSMNPMSRNASGHVGLMQWSKTRQADFERKYHYQMGASDVPASQQFSDQMQFAQDELRTTQQKAASAMARAADLMGKTKAFMDLDEAPGDNSLSKRFANAEIAARLADTAGMVESANARSAPVQHTVTSETHIGEVNVHTLATDPKSHVNAVADGLANHPLLNFDAQGNVSLATRGMTG